MDPLDPTCPGSFFSSTFSPWPAWLSLIPTPITYLLSPFTTTNVQSCYPHHTTVLASRLHSLPLSPVLLSHPPLKDAAALRECSRRSFCLIYGSPPLCTPFCGTNRTSRYPMASDAPMDQESPVDQEPPVLRIIPDCSLSEPAMLQLLDAIELRSQMGGMPAFFAQFVFSASDRFPSLLTQYPTMEDTEKILQFAARKTPITIHDRQVSGEQVEKVVHFQIFREEDHDSIQQALAPVNTGGGAGGAPTRRGPTTLLILREWGIISMTTDKETHLRDLATFTRDGFRQATPEQTIELAEPQAVLMTPRITGPGPKRFTAVGVWFVGKLYPPANGNMYVGRGQLQSGARTVGLSPHPVSFAPLRGARLHSALSMPGWRYDRTKECMVERSDEPAPAIRPASPPRDGRRGGRGRGYGGTSNEIILSTAVERENFLLTSDRERFLQTETELASFHRVTTDQICPFATKWKMTGKDDFTCRINQGCHHPKRLDSVTRYPCCISNTVPPVTFSIAAPPPPSEPPTHLPPGKGKGPFRFENRTGLSGSSSSLPPSATAPSAPDPTPPDSASGSVPLEDPRPLLEEDPSSMVQPEADAREVGASSGNPAEAPSSDAQLNRAAAFLENIGPLMDMALASEEMAASEELATADFDSVSLTLSTAPVMITDPTTAPYVPLSATLRDIFGHIDVALSALGRLVPTNVLLDPEIRSNIANLATPELCLQAASDYLTRLRAECREANNKKRPLARASAGASSDASRDASPAPPAKK